MRTCTHTKRVWVSETMGICVSGHRLKMRELAHELFFGKTFMYVCMGVQLMRMCVLDVALCS